MSPRLKALQDSAMECVTLAQAEKCMDALIEAHLADIAAAGRRPMTAGQSHKIQRVCLAYLAHQHGDETRARVEELFQCAHPIFGRLADYATPGPEEAFFMGVETGMLLKRNRRKTPNV